MRQPYRRTTNLLPIQQRAIAALVKRTDVLIVNCDKNLGPAVIDTTTYVSRAYSDHLANTDTYEELTQDEATNHTKGVANKL